MKIAWDPNMILLDKAQKLSTSQQKLTDVAEQFEALFLQQLFAEMRKTVTESDLFGDRKAEKLFESMLDEELSQDMARSGGIGLSNVIYQQMIDYVSDSD